MRSWLALAVFIFSTGVVCGQEKAKEVTEDEAAVQEEAVEAVAVAGVAVDRLSAAVDTEMKILQKFTKLSDESIEGLKLGLKPFLNAERKRLNNASSFFGGPELLTPKTLKAIANAADAIVSDSKLVEQYREDAKCRTDFQRDAAITSTLASIDSWVGLSAKQVKPIQDELGKLYDKGSLAFAPMIEFQALGGADKLKSIEPLLREDQRRFFKRFGKESRNGFAAVVTEAGTEPDREKARKELKDKLRDVAEMKIGQLNTEFDLSTKQLRRLELLGKRVISKALDVRMAAEEEYRQYMERIQAGGGGGVVQMDQKMMGILSAHPVQLFESQTEWDKFVGGTISESQQETLKKSKIAGLKRNSSMLSYMLVLSLGRQFSMNGKQQVATHKLFSDKFGPIPMPSMGGLGMMDTYAKLLAISEDEYKAAMGDENWEKFKPLLGQVRTQVDQMKEQEEAEDE